MNFAPFAFQNQAVSTPSIVTSGLQVYLDAGITTSYPGTGTTWNDLSGNGVNLTLTNLYGHHLMVVISYLTEQMII